MIRLPASSASLHEFVEAFESAKVIDVQVDLADFLPERDHPLYAAVLREMIRVDLEYAWQSGRPATFDDYARRFPAIRDDSQARKEIAFESSRLRRQVPQNGAHEDTDPTAEVPLLRNLWQRDVDAAERPGEFTRRMPDAGDEFLGFQLLADLGRGAFARVFLARQGELSDRHVVLKISSDVFGEAQTLARLQHSHIVPIYSLHRDPPFQAVCMPYLGSTTLADVVRQVADQNALPDSGSFVVTTINQRSGLTERSNTRSPIPTAPHQPVPAQVAMRTLEKLTYVQSVMWMIARLADGLAHAHERGILHRDLKPANVLLTDHGEPMLLDFNLSVNTQAPAQSLAALGGTMPYMSPEHLEAFRGRSSVVDQRSDIYALGVILFELLTGRPPFHKQSGEDGANVVERMLAERRQPPPRLRPWNRAISPALESIVRHCLEPDARQRYRSARELQHDLDRQLRNEPLRFAHDPSPVERLRKFRLRHPRLTSAASMAAAALVLLTILATTFVVRGQRLAFLEARENQAHFNNDFQTVQFLLSARSAGQTLDHGIDTCKRTLGRYGILDDVAWRAQPLVSYLPAADRQCLERNSAHLLTLLARAVALQGLGRAAGQQPLRDALHLCSLARSCAPPPRALLQLEADLHAQLGNHAEAKQLADRAAATTLQTARDYYLTAHVEAEHGRFRPALDLLRTAKRLDPQDASVHLLEGICHDYLEDNAQAAASYSTCIALRPDFHGGYFNRGLANLRQGRYSEARADFDEVIRLRPRFAEAYSHRALAFEGEREFARAVHDLTHALNITAAARLYFMRARVHEKAGHTEAARRDLALGLATTPTDEVSSIARGLGRLTSDAAGALEDFEHALQCNPRSLAALQNKAHVLAKQLQRTRDAIAVLDLAVQYYPEDVRPLAGRGVLRARLGEREAALRDAEAALVRDDSAANLYQVAGIYALTSKAHAADAREALRLLAAALHKGFAAEQLLSDPDLEALHADPVFIRMARP